MKKRSTVVGNLSILTIPDNVDQRMTRRIRIWTPKEYDPKKVSKVIYMFDGQNLFDERTGHYGEWKIDESMKVVDKCHDYIVVGLDYSARREHDYCPLIDSIHLSVKEKKSSAYKIFMNLIETIIPYVESHYRCDESRNGRTIGGSSMGGLMTLYGYARFNKYFANYLCFSPAECAYHGNSVIAPQIYDDNLRALLKCTPDTSKIFLSVGGVGFEEEFVDDFKNLVNIFKFAGYTTKNLKHVYRKHYEHNEEAWALLFRTAFNFINTHEEE